MRALFVISFAVTTALFSTSAFAQDQAGARVDRMTERTAPQGQFAPPVQNAPRLDAGSGKPKFVQFSVQPPAATPPASTPTKIPQPAQFTPPTGSATLPPKTAKFKTAKFAPAPPTPVDVTPAGVPSKPSRQIEVAENAPAPPPPAKVVAEQKPAAPGPAPETTGAVTAPAEEAPAAQAEAEPKQVEAPGAVETKPQAGEAIEVRPAKRVVKRKKVVRIYGDTYRGYEGDYGYGGGYSYGGYGGGCD
jgi:hypothetical protein